MSLIPLVPSSGWVRRGLGTISDGGHIDFLGKLLGNADVAKGIARLGTRADEFKKVAHVPGAKTLLAKLLHTSREVAKGAEFELEFALKHTDDIDEIGKVLETINGGAKEIDFVLKGNVFVNTKLYNWTKYNEFLLQRIASTMTDEARSSFKYGPSSVKYAFKGSVPDIIRSALEAAGVIVEVIP